MFGQEATAANIVASFIMFMFGAAVVFAVEVSARDKGSERTPEKFNLWFLLKDNQVRIFYTILIGNIVIILGANVTLILGFTMPDVVGRYTPLVAGLLSDYIAMSIKNKFVKNATPSAPLGNN